jgi:hypothetical protein
MLQTRHRCCNLERLAKRVLVDVQSPKTVHALQSFDTANLISADVEVNDPAKSEVLKVHIAYNVAASAQCDQAIKISYAVQLSNAVVVDSKFTEVYQVSQPVEAFQVVVRDV